MSKPHLNYPSARKLDGIDQGYNVLVIAADATLTSNGGVVNLASGVDVVLPKPYPGTHWQFIVPIVAVAATVLAPAGFTFDGTNNKATSNTTVASGFEVVYKDADEFQVIATVGTVTMSAV